MAQGTIKYFDSETNTGAVLLDNQEELSLDAETFAATGLMELRVGQRVRLEIEEGPNGPRIAKIGVISI